MDTWQAWVEWAIALMRVLVVVGLVVRHRMRRALLFPAYLGTSAVVQGLRLLWPDRFYRWDFWVAKELLLRVLAASVVVEITVRVFARLPGAAPWARRALLLVLLATALATWTAPGVGGEPIASSWLFVMVTEVLPRLAFGSAVLCAATLGVMMAFGVPLDDLHGAVLFGLALYLSLYAAPLGSAGVSEFWRFVAYHVTPVVYLAVLGLWAYAAWRREREPEAPGEVVERLQPWR